MAHFPGPLPEKDLANSTATRHLGKAVYQAKGFGAFTNVRKLCGMDLRLVIGPTYYRMLAANGPVGVSPKGPEDRIDPSEPGVAEESAPVDHFLCSGSYCSANARWPRKGKPIRHHHLGFRLLQDSGDSRRLATQSPRENRPLLQRVKTERVSSCSPVPHVWGWASHATLIPKMQAAARRSNSGETYPETKSRAKMIPCPQPSAGLIILA